MSFLKKMFGSSPEALVDKADKLYDSSDYGSAKLTYEKALGQVPEDAQNTLREKIATCCDAIASKRLKEAARYKASGQLELAKDELDGAQEVAKSEALQKSIQQAFDTLEEADALEQAEAQPITDEERLALLIGQWGDAQADEYETYGDAAFSGLLALSKDEYQRGREELEAILSDAEAPCYLWLEVGRARLLCEDIPASAEAFEAFLTGLPKGEGADARLAAHVELARIADDAGEVDRAMGEFERAVDNLPNDYHPYLAMGTYLRQKEHAPEAIEVLKTAQQVATTDEPDWRLLQELGLAHADNGQTKDSIAYLEQVIDFFNSYQEHDYPPSTALPLATLLESEGNLERAADMYRALCNGSDQQNHAVYHLQAGRLLGELGLADESHRMLTRAKALSENTPELLESVAKALESLGKNAIK